MLVFTACFSVSCYSSMKEHLKKIINAYRISDLFTISKVKKKGKKYWKLPLYVYICSRINSFSTKSRQKEVVQNQYYSSNSSIALLLEYYLWCPDNVIMLGIRAKIVFFKDSLIL